MVGLLDAHDHIAVTYSHYSFITPGGETRASSLQILRRPDTCLPVFGDSSGAGLPPMMMGLFDRSRCAMLPLRRFSDVSADVDLFLLNVTRATARPD